jgi:hypothetical protein
MVKKIQILTLLIIILAAFIFTFLYASFNFNISSLKNVNDNFRPFFAENFFLRRTFSLNNSGEAKGDYFSDKQFNKLKVEVYATSFGTLYAPSIDLIKEGTGGAINKSEGIFIEEKKLEDVPDTVDDSFIDKLAGDIPRYSKNTAVMRIYILSTYKPQPTLTGLTAGAYSFIIFKRSIEEASEDFSVQKDLEIETILHETGHLLGAKHLDSEGCVMNEIVDVPSTGRLNLIPTKYCFDDLQAIKDANS